MEPNDIRQYVIDTLRDYKRLVALKNELKYDFDGYLSGLRLDGMPHGTEMSEPIIAAIKRKRAEIKEVNKEIKRIDNWLNYLDDRERHYLSQMYIENRFKMHAQNSWTAKHNEYLSRRTWGKVHTAGLNKLKNLIKDKKRKPPE